MRSWILTLTTLFVGGLTSCEHSLDMGPLNGGNYDVVENVYGYLRDEETQRVERLVDIYTGETLSVELYLGLTKAIDKGVDVVLKADPAYVDAYNKEHKTRFELYPAMDLVSFEQQGVVTVAPGDRKSETVSVTVAMNDEVLPNTTYILPLAAQMQTEGVELSADGTHYVLLIRSAGAIPETTKGTVKTVLYFEVNDTNPLNALEFKMKESGKPFWDYVILFAANIKCDQVAGRVHVYNNPNVQFLLDNREQYIKPLQDAGIKVLLGILGDHDDAGIGQLADATALDFARELKAVVDAFELDGVNFDDEWSNEAPSGPGFVTPSSASAARLCYETKKLMPDKLLSVFMWNTLETGFNNVFDGYLPGDYVDIALPNYGGAIADPASFPGMSIRQCAANSIELRRFPFTDEAALRRMREDGYGYQMSFALNPSLYKKQVACLQIVAKTLYDDSLVYPEYCYRKNETKRIPLSEF